MRIRGDYESSRHIVLCINLLVFSHLCSVGGENKLPPPKHGNTYVIAHRGFHKGYPENTLIAYQKAIELGVDFIEVDLRTTADGHIVSVHNSTIDAYAQGVKGAIAGFTLAELKKIDVGSYVSPEFADQRVPTLEEILTLCQGKVGLYLDMKNADPEKVLQLLDKYGMRYRVVWYGGMGVLDKVKRLCPDCFIMPDPGPEKHLEYMLNRFHPPIIASDFKSCTETFVQRCRERGALVFVDDAGPDSWEESLRRGVNGIQTDHPDLLIQYLKQKSGNKSE